MENLNRYFRIWLTVMAVTFAVLSATGQNTVGPFTFYPTNQGGTMQGQAQIGIIAAVSGDIIAAFDPSGECVGAALLTINAGTAYINFVIYGDDGGAHGMSSGEAFTLKLYDASATTTLTYPTALTGWANTKFAPMPGYNTVTTVYNFVYNMLAVTPATRDVTSEAGTTTFAVASNTSWTVTESVSWFTVSPMSGSNDGYIAVTYDENNSMASRTGQIKVTAIGGFPAVNVTLTQSGIVLFVYAGADATICQGSPHTLAGTASIQASVLWSTSGNGTFSSTSSLTPVYTPGASDITAGTVTLTLTASVNAPCAESASDNMVLTIQKSPTANAGADATICQTTTHNLAGSATNNSSVLWTTSGTGTFSSTSSLTPVYTPGATDISAGMVTLTLTASAISPCTVSVSDNKILNIQKTPTVNAGVDAAICQTGTDQLAGTAQNHSSVLWTTSGNGTFSSTSSLTPVYTPAAADISTGTVTLTLNASAISPCTVSVSDNKILTIQKTPTSNAGADATICQTGTAQLAGSAQNKSSVLWTTSGTGTFSVPNTLTPVYTPGGTDISAGAVTLTLTASAISPCTVTVSDTKILNIQKAPTANAGSDATICQTGAAQLVGTAQNQSSVLWMTSGNGTFSSTSSLTTVYEPSAADISSGAVNLTLKASAISPCSVSTYDTKILNIQKTPTSNAGTDATICQTGTAQLMGIVQNKSSVLWTTSGNGTFNNASILNPVYTPSAPDISADMVTLTLTASAISPCTVSASDTKILNIQKTPLADAGIDATICQNGTAQLAGSAQNQNSVLWSTSGTGTFSSTSSLTPVYTPGAVDISSGAVTLTLTASAISPCTLSAYDTKILNIQKTPTANAGTDATICQTGTAQLSGTAQNQSSVLWTTSGTGTFSSTNTLISGYTPGATDISAGFVTLTLTASAVSPCLVAFSDSKILAIQKTPTANAGLNATICLTETAQLAGSAQYQSSVLWTTSGNGTFSSTSSLTPVYTPSATDISSGTVTLTLTASAVSPCLVTFSNSKILSIQKTPTANAGDDATICQNETVQLIGTAQNQSSVSWSTSGNGTFSNATILNPVYTPGAADMSSGAVTLTLTASAISPCLVAFSDNKILAIQQTPAANAGQDGTICHNEVYSVVGSISYSQASLWTTSGDGTFDVPNSLSANYSLGQNDILLGNALLTLTAQPTEPCSISATDQLNLVVNYCHDLSIHTGWSGISTFVNPLDPELDTIFNNVLNELIILYSPTGIFWPGQNVNTIVQWNRLEGYTIKVANQIDLRIAGSRSADRTLQLSQGWNLIPVLSGCNADVEALFAETGVVMVKEVAGWQLYWPALNINTLGTLQSGKAYFVLMNAPAVISFPACLPDTLSPGINSGSYKIMEEMINTSPWNIFGQTAQSHIIGIAKSSINSSLIKSGDLLGAFDQFGQCYGLVNWEGENTSLTVFGDDLTTSAKDGFIAGETINLRLFIASTAKEYELEVTYDQDWLQNDGLFYSNGLSIISQFETISNSVSNFENWGIEIYPNPAKDQLNIIVPELDGQIIQITNINGQQVYSGELLYRQAKIDISLFRQGIYFVKILSEKCNYVQKVVKD